MENISPEIIEHGWSNQRLKSLGHVVGLELLHVNELELVEIHVLDNSPTVVLQFACNKSTAFATPRRKQSSKGPGDDSIRALSVGDAVLGAEFQTEDGRTFKADVAVTRDGAERDDEYHGIYALFVRGRIWR